MVVCQKFDFHFQSTPIGAWESLTLFALLFLIATSALAQSGFPGTGQRPQLKDIGPLPDDWLPGKFDRRTGAWDRDKARNIKWVAELGSQSFGPPVVADGRVFVGTNNSNGYLPRYPAETDLGCLLCFRESDGKFLWQHSSEKLPTGRVHDLTLQGIQSAPWVEGQRAWFVTNRGEVVCLDTRGFEDQEDDGEKFAESSVFSLRGREGIDRQTVTASLNREHLPEAIAEFLTENWHVKADGYLVEVIEAGKAWRAAHPSDQNLPSFTIAPDLWGFRVSRDGALPGPHDADVVWRLDMMEEFGSRQHNNSMCCVTTWKDTLFVCTGNGVYEDHITIPTPDAPSFVALDKHTGKTLWTSNLPGKNIHHGNWSSPAVGVLGSVPQVIFNSGDGWTYSFHAERWDAGKPTLLWKFDTNAKDAILELGGRGTRNEPIGVPVLHDGLVYITVGQDVEHGEGPGCIWCLDPTKSGDVSAELAVLRADRKKIVPHDRIRAVRPEKGEIAIPNPNSAVVWKYVGRDRNSDGTLEFDESMHRTITPVVISGELIFATDFSGLVHCLDLKTGRQHWTYDCLAAVWSPPFVADGKVYVTDEDGDVAIFRASAEPAAAEPLREINMLSSCYTPPTVSQGVLFIASKDRLFAIGKEVQATREK